MLSRRTILGLCLGQFPGLILGTGWAPAPASGREPALETPAWLDAVSAESLWAHAAYLGGDYLAGRAPGTLGGERAAEYLARALARLGLEPLGEDGTYYQSLPLHGGTPLPDTRLILRGAEEGQVLEFNEDFLLYTTGAETQVAQPVPLVFVGYGIVAPEYDYNDYGDLDVEGSLVVCLSGEPVSDRESYFAGPADTKHAWAGTKQLTAFSRGALGSLLIPLARVHGNRSWEEWIRLFGLEHVTSPYGSPHGLDLLLRPELGRLLFEGAEQDFAEVLARDGEGAVRGFPLPGSAAFEGRFQERDYLSSNVVGMLPGSDPDRRDSFVLVCAHYDHLGTGPAMDGDAVYNGVVDNALGTAALLEIARILSLPSRRPPRSVIFLLTTAEEKGLLGARYYCRHPALPLSRTVAAVNLDGAAVIDTFHDVVGVGAELSGIDRHLAEAARVLGLEVSPVPPLFDSADAFTMSDQFAFAEAGVPSILVMEGRDYRNLPDDVGFARFLEWSRTRYHTPFDDLSQPVSRDAVLQYCQVNLALVDVLARTADPPSWNPGLEYGAERLRSVAEGR